jgi:hypothetical protein
MIWGEPSRSPNFKPFYPANPLARKLTAKQKIAPHLYARILDAAYGALKGVSRSNLVIGGMTFGAADLVDDLTTAQWIENLRLPDGKPPRLDMYGHNPFSYRDPNLSNPPSASEQIDFSDLGRLAKLVDRYLGRHANPHPKLFISEWTIPTKVDLEFNFYVEPLLQARWITDALRCASLVAGRASTRSAGSTSMTNHPSPTAACSKPTARRSPATRPGRPVEQKPCARR